MNNSEQSAGARWVRRHLASACVCCAVISFGLGESSHAQQSIDKALINKEINKRSENLVLAQELLSSGDTHYQKHEFKEAVEDYAQAFSLVPRAGMTGEIRFATADRYAQAAVVYGRELAKIGKYDDARKLIDKVLVDDVAPGYKDAMVLKAQLEDPIRYNQELTPQHIRNIEGVAHWLRKGEGRYDLGQFDEAVLAYEEVLRIDKYNVAARRGMEKVVHQMSMAADAGRDLTRAKMFAEVDAGWETALGLVEESVVAGDNVIEGARIQEVRGNKLKQMVIPVVDFSDIGIEEAVDIIRSFSKKYDTTELDVALQGENFILNIGSRTSDYGSKIRKKRINLDLRNVPMEKLLDYVTQATGTQWRIEEHAVVITPAGATDGMLYSRSFRVPPSFMIDAASAGNDDEDVFDDAGSGKAFQPKLNTQEYLAKLGISFPDGASARYVAGSNMLMVRNTVQNLDLVEDYVRTISHKESVQVVVRVTLIDILQADLEELGYDWLIGQGKLGDNMFLGGGSTGSAGSEVESLAPLLSSGVDPLTSGLRSGDTMFETNFLDRTILGNLAKTENAQRGSSPLAVRGQLNNANFETILRALDQKKGISKIQTPSVICRPGEQAHIGSVREFIYPSEYEPPQLPNGVGGGGNGGFPVTPSQPGAFEMRPLGLTMDTEATVSDDKHYISLKINPEIVNFDGFINFGSPIQATQTNPDTGETSLVNVTANAILMPIFRKIGLDTNVVIQDGSTIVVGGLNQHSIQDVEDKVPVLGDMPLVGRFFRNQGLLNSKRALIIFVNAELVDPTGRPWRDR